MYKIDVEYIDIYSSLIRQLTNVAPLWRDVTTMMNRAAEDIFSSEGGTWGVSKWLPLSSTMMNKVRRGTDGRAWGFYTQGSRLLNASGKYRKSFRKISQRPLSMVYGSNYSFRTKKNTVSGGVIPYAGRGKMKKRDTQPNVASGRFRAEMAKVESRFLDAVILKAVAAGVKKK